MRGVIICDNAEIIETANKINLTETFNCWCLVLIVYRKKCNEVYYIGLYNCIETMDYTFHFNQIQVLRLLY